MLSSVYLIDIVRILNGNTPAVFFIELVIRAVLIYVTLVAGLRFMGKRMASRMSRNELAAMASLAAAIGIPIQTPDKGLLPAIVMAGVVVMVQRIIATRSIKHPSFERLTQGDISLLVKDGCMMHKEMEKTRVSRERLLSELRSSGIRQLGEVKRLYLEAGGYFTLIRDNDAPPGLSAIPDWDKEFEAEQKKAPDKTVCHYCGCEVPSGNKACPNCGKDELEQAIY
ncbi:YetF domain-containing protein [uncultured Chitinophaga sp.]|jgi:Predicted membrane protein|uniref:YetF domain-containing protein n=1 Tax=uncultured Chitinophaga sp. TaxID=339340 RepID=UPI00260D6D3E|nr:YetF domain-containing protein [uncultured Chitinophaga sp.]